MRFCVLGVHIPDDSVIELSLIWKKVGSSINVVHPEKDLTSSDRLFSVQRHLSYITGFNIDTRPEPGHENRGAGLSEVGLAGSHVSYGILCKPEGALTAALGGLATPPRLSVVKFSNESGIRVRATYTFRGQDEKKKV